MIGVEFGGFNLLIIASSDHINRVASSIQARGLHMVTVTIKLILLASLSEGDLRVHNFIATTERLRVAGPDKLSCFNRPTPFVSLQIDHTLRRVVHPSQVGGIPHDLGPKLIEVYEPGRVLLGFVLARTYVTAPIALVGGLNHPSTMFPMHLHVDIFDLFDESLAIVGVVDELVVFLGPLLLLESFKVAMPAVAVYMPGRRKVVYN